MRIPLLRLVVSLALVACASTRAERAPETPALRFTYHAALASVPPGATEVRLGVRVPEHGPGGELRAVSAYGVVGNAPFEVVLSGADSGAIEREHLRVSWQRVSGDEGAREVVLESHGKPLELGLRLALNAGAGKAMDAKALEAALAGKTWAEVDAQRVSGLETRCERVR